MQFQRITSAGSALYELVTGRPIGEVASDIPASSFTGEQLRDSLRFHSFLIVRDLINPERIAHFRQNVIPNTRAYFTARSHEEIEGPFMASLANKPARTSYDFFRGMIDGHMFNDTLVQYASGGRDRIYDLINEPEFHGEVHAAFPGFEFNQTEICHIRSVSSKDNVSSEGEKRFFQHLPLHCDIFYHVNNLFMLNAWVPMDHCGIKAQRPTLQIVDCPLSKGIKYAKSKFSEANEKPLLSPLVFEPSVEAEIEREFGPDKLVELDLSPGDVAIFTNWTFHRTHATKTMTKDRSSAEIRLMTEPDALDSLLYGF